MNTENLFNLKGALTQCGPPHKYATGTDHRLISTANGHNVADDNKIRHNIYIK